MPAAPNSSPLTVRRHERGRFLVKSQRLGSETLYLVEIDDPRFPQGRCGCPDFQIRVESYLLRGEEPEKNNCKHCAAVFAIIEHARNLCAAAGLPYSENIIPKL